VAYPTYRQKGKMMAEACPDRKGDCYYEEGKIGTSEYAQVAETVFICAPELTIRTRPFFIEQLKNAGVKVDFDFNFSLGLAKKLNFQKQVELIRSLGSEKTIGEVSL
jgi:hypothetical protein